MTLDARFTLSVMKKAHSNKDGLMCIWSIDIDNIEKLLEERDALQAERDALLAERELGA